MEDSSFTYRRVEKNKAAAFARPKPKSKRAAIQKPAKHLPPSSFIYYKKTVFTDISFFSFYQVMRHYNVIGRKAPTDNEPNPQLYRMQIFAENEVTAKSRFWYFLHQYKKMKKTTGEILSVNEIVEKNARIVKNYAVWLRYNSRSGTHNMCKEFRDTTLVGAVNQLYNEMAGRHRARRDSIQIIKHAIIGAKDCNRVSLKQYHNSKVKFPLVHRRPRVEKKYRKRFSAVRPSTFVQ